MSSEASKQIDSIVELGAEKIHLRCFPPEAISAVIMGAKASDDTVARVRDILEKKYPHAKLQRTTPQRMTGIFALEDL